MNVAFDPWIPVLTAQGKVVEASLCDIFCKGQAYADLSVFPHERVALMRLFSAVAHASLDGPEDSDEWKKAPDQLPAAASKYLEKWKNSFELYDHARPWLQFAGLKDKNGKTGEDANWISVTKLAFHLASGNNSTLFDHGRLPATFDPERLPTTSEVLCSMLAYQCFSPGGLVGQLFLGNEQTSKSSKDAPCCPSSMMHAFIRGKNLYETITVNLPSYELIKAHYNDIPLGRPVWENMPQSLGDEERIENATRTYLGRLVPVKRLIRLHEDGQKLLLGDGPDYSGHHEGFPAEPTATIAANGEKRNLLSYRPSKAIWRELGAIIIRRHAETGIGGPLCLGMCGANGENNEFDLTVSALARDQAAITDIAEAVFHISPALQKDGAAELYNHGVSYAETVFDRLSRALETYRKTLDAGWEGRLKTAGPSKKELKAQLVSLAAEHYWTRVESNLHLLFGMIEKVGSDLYPSAEKEWQTLLRQTARDAYSCACGQSTPRQVKAFAQGWGILNRPLPDGDGATEKGTNTRKKKSRKTRESQE